MTQTSEVDAVSLHCIACGRYLGSNNEIISDGPHLGARPTDLTTFCEVTGRQEAVVNGALGLNALREENEALARLINDDSRVMGRDTEIARLEFEVCQAAIDYVNGVGYDGNSLQSQADAIQRFADLHNTLVASTKVLITARRKVEAAALYPKSELPPEMFERNPILQGEDQ